MEGEEMRRVREGVGRGLRRSRGGVRGGKVDRLWKRRGVVGEVDKDYGRGRGKEMEGEMLHPFSLSSPLPHSYPLLYPCHTPPHPSPTLRRRKIRGGGREGI